jgi:hypothetical protein
MEGHIHTTATHGLWVLSVVLVSVFLARTYVGNHPDSTLGRTLAFYFG